MDMNWTRVSVAMNTTGITKRYSHSAIVCDDLMYVFGGCTSSMTTFNDLWKLDLNTRMWVRPLTTGAYPSPKACSTLVQYKEMLSKALLWKVSDFGGIGHPFGLFVLNLCADHMYAISH